MTRAGSGRGGTCRTRRTAACACGRGARGGRRYASPGRSPASGSAPSTPRRWPRAHDVAALAIKGRASAHLNFPETAHRLPRPATAAPEDVRAAAALAAQMDRAPDADADVKDTEARVEEEPAPAPAPAAAAHALPDDDIIDLALFDLPEFLHEFGFALPPSTYDVSSWHDDFRFEPAPMLLWEH
ncbi:hypothetical protein ZWY2020_021398 [Hordeum vulgare]|nr:hypothetical protein ZWY2020_021398 [Hordeum vulgare]